MAVAYRASAVANSGGSAASSIIVNAPAGWQQDDFLYVFIVYTGGTGVTITAPSGWTLNQTSDTDVTYGLKIFRRVAGTNAGSSYTFTLSSAQHVAALSVAYSGLRLRSAGGAFFPQSGSSTLNGSGTATTAHTLNTPNMSPAYGVRVVASYNPTGALTVVDAGAGLTKRDDTSTTGGSFVQVALTDGIVNSIPYNSSTFAAAGLSGSSTANKSVAFWLRQDQAISRTPEVDSYSSANHNGVTSGSISLSPSLSAEPALVVFQIRGATASVSSVTTPGVTWTLLSSSQNAGNTCRTEVWTATLGDTIASYTASYTFSASAVARVVAMNFSGAGPIKNFSSGWGDAGHPSAYLTTTGVNSRVYGFIADANNSVATVVAPNTLNYQFAYLTAGQSSRMVEQLVASANTSVNSAMTLAAASGWSMVQVEVSAPKYTATNMLHFFD